MKDIRRMKPAKKLTIITAVAVVLAVVIVFSVLYGTGSKLFFPTLTFTPEEEIAEELVLKFSVENYKIVYAEGATDAEIAAANILAESLTEITEKSFSAEKGADGEGGEFLIGEAAGKLSSEFSGEEYHIENTADGDILIAGGRPRGVIYGVYAFLEKYFDCRWYTPQFKTLPKRTNAMVPEIKTESFAPILEYRHTDWLTTTDTKFEFSVANGLNYSLDVKNSDEILGGRFGYQGSWCHSLTEMYVNSDKYFAEHPEWFAYREDIGARLGGYSTQLCLTNEEVLAKCIEEVKAQCAIGNELLKGERFIISLTQADNFNFCQCEKCKAADEEEGSHAGTNLRFVNAVANAIKDEYPNVQVDTFAYQYTRTPPKITKPAENVLVRLCSIEGCLAHTMDDPDCPDNARFAADLTAWGGICDNIYIWEYSTNYGAYNVVFPNFHVLQKNMQFFVENNVKGVYSEGNHQAKDSDSEFAALRGYLIAKLMKDPYMDFEGELKKFLKAFYGEGWQYVREYMRLLSANTGKDGFFGGHRKLHIYISPTDKALLDLKPNEIKYADMLWDKAVELSAGDEFYTVNLDKSRISWRFWKALNRIEEFSPSKNASGYRGENKKLYQDLKKYDITIYHETWWLQGQHQLIKPESEIDWSDTPASWHDGPKT